MSWETYLKKIYYDPASPASFSGPGKLYMYVKKHWKYNISKYRIQKWLQRQEPYSLQRPLRRPMNRTHIVVVGIEDQWSADLMDMVKFSKYNDGFSYILVVIDVFSRYLWLQKLKDKKGHSVASAFEDIFKGGRQPNRIRTDLGQEFKSRLVQSVFKSAGIRHFYAYNEVKSFVSERAIKSIKTKIYRYFAYKQSYRDIDKLQRFAKGYNNTIHSSIDMPPAQVNKIKEETVCISTFLANHKKGPTKFKHFRFRFKIGDRVRITHLGNIFTRQYDDKWTGGIFAIAQRFWRQGVPVYRIKDYNGEYIKGTFFQSELQNIAVKNSNLWKVEKVLRTKGTGQNKQYLVKWLQWPSKFSS